VIDIPPSILTTVAASTIEYSRQSV